MVDLLFFFFIFAVFLLSFGVAYQANLYPNSPPSWYLLKSVIYIPYWQMYGELFLENMEGNTGITSLEANHIKTFLVLSDFERGGVRDCGIVNYVKIHT